MSVLDGSGRPGAPDAASVCGPLPDNCVAEQLGDSRPTSVRLNSQFQTLIINS